jgi:hypothetical protein
MKILFLLISFLSFSPKIYGIEDEKIKEYARETLAWI